MSSINCVLLNNSIGNLSNSIGNISNVGTTTYNSVEKILQFYIDNGYLPNLKSMPLVPKMKSNTAPSGEAFASSQGSGYEAYKGFDGNNSTFWWNNNGGVVGAYIGYKFTKKVIVTSLSMMSHDQEGIRTFKVQASNDMSSWTDLSGTLSLGSLLTLTTHNLNNSKSYQYYRIYVLSSNGSSNVNMRTLQFYGYYIE